MVKCVCNQPHTQATYFLPCGLGMRLCVCMYRYVHVHVNVQYAHVVKYVCICGSPGEKLNIILSHISSASSSLMRYSTELLLRAGLIATCKHKNI